MNTTRTGGFPIGFRRMERWPWHKDLEGMVRWAKGAGFDAIDLGRDGDTTAKAVAAAGLKVGSVDLPVWDGMLSPDAAKRKDAVARNSAYVNACAAFGPMNHFLAMLPEKPDLPRRENFRHMVESFAELAPALERNRARLVIEGWPGPGGLCCTPEGYRAFFKECPSKRMGVNYDPSHLVRMGIDPLRFLREFADRVYHMHAKDAEISTENLYEYGNVLPPIFKEKRNWGSMHWRYTLPGFGSVRWVDTFQILAERNYAGIVSIEHEDVRFWEGEDNQKTGLLTGLTFLKRC
ncbi:MAG: sugar phosphate isomerase/epimerase [Verrucomicrobiota bacterium]|nr:sugar phosphate isomerase/epimerase [Verrucomicrobiota bacterium]